MLSTMHRIAAALIVVLSVARAAGAGEQFLADCRALTTTPHRLTGTDELLKAAQHVEKRLRAIGLDDVVVQDFKSARLATKRCELLMGEGQDVKRIALLPMRPNGIIAPVSPPAGIKGRLLHAGMGEPEDFPESPEGRIVVLDYCSHGGWFYAFRLGARAVVFTASPKAESWQRHSIEADANLPRYFYRGSASDLPDGLEATINSEIVWQPAPGRNVFGFIRGTDPALQPEEMGPEVLILAANLDSYGEVPEISPGARGAATCAGLLKIAEHLIQNRPRRNVLIAFFDAQAFCHTGSSALYRALEDKEGLDVHIANRRISLKHEQDYVSQLGVALDSWRTVLTAEADAGVLSRILYEEPEPFALMLIATVAFVGLMWGLTKQRVLAFIGAGVLAVAFMMLILGAAIQTNAEKSTAGQVEVAAGSEEVMESSFFVKATLEYPGVLTALLCVAVCTVGAFWWRDRKVWMALVTSGAIVLLVAIPTAAAFTKTAAEAQAELTRKESAGSQTRRRLVALLKKKGEEHVNDIGAPLQDTRTTIKELGKSDDPDAEAQIARLLEQKAEYEAIVGKWNNLRRALSNENLTEEVMSELEFALKEVAEDVSVRAKELEFDKKTLECDEKVQALMSKDGGGLQWVSLHVSLLLGDGSSRWGLIIGGESPLHSDKDLPGLYGKIQRSFLNAYESLRNKPGFPENFETASADGSLSSTRVLWGAPYLVHSGEAAGRMGFYNLAIGTSQESLPREGTPIDTLEALDLANIENQVDEIAVVLHQVSFEEGISLRRSIVPDKAYHTPIFDDQYRVGGPRVMAKTRASSIPNKPLRNVVVRYNIMRTTGRAYVARKPYAFETHLVSMTNQNGSYEFGPVRHDPGRWWMRGFAVKFDERGEPAFASNTETSATVDYRLNMYNCNSGVAILPPVFEPKDVVVLGAKGNFSLEEAKSYFSTYDGVVYWYCEDKIKSVKLFQQETMVLLTSGADTSEDRKALGEQFGQGLPLGDDWQIPSSARIAASDLWDLNEKRMAILHSRGMMDGSIQELHGRAQDLSKAAAESDSVAKASALDASAFLAEVPVYRNTRFTLDDLVHAVLVLLALSVPFAFALERLLIGATSIYRQIAYFAGFFVITFLILFFSHPAFAVSKTPMIIFLGFAILILSGLVIVVVMRRFEWELKTLQGLTSTVHSADVSRFNTMMAAMAMGISTMRRRPLRTALTATTIVLLTFTILCFASFGKKTGVVKLFLMPPPGHTGVMTRDVNWRELGEGVYEVLDGRWGSAATVVPRYWVSPERDTDAGFLITRIDGSSPVPMRGVLGLDPKELTRRPDMAGVIGELSGDMDDYVWLTEPVAKSLKVDVGDYVLVAGMKRKVGGKLGSGMVSEVADMDGSSILPVDFVEMKSTKAEKEVDESGLALASRENWAALPTDAVVIAGTRTAMQMGASLRAVMLYADDATKASKIAEDIARILPLPIAATRTDGVFRHFLGSIIQAGGAKDLVFPIVLGGLVIFGTMLGSVADREKEIFTFSALGLAPPHVASLFFAETLVYSVVGGLGGYLLAQASMKILEYLAEFGLVSVPEMNYSSTNAIITLVIVMATVLASSIYPAMRASRSANPGILRSWRLPPPEGDHLNIVFPFTVSEYDITGVVSFLKEHFDNLADAGLGVFMSRDARLVRGGDSGPSVGLKALLALAPFDLGVTQNFELTSAPSEIPGIDLVKIKIVRASGQPKDWARLNKVLLDDLRKQFLIWRSLPRETMELYRHRTLATMADLVAE